ncbi:MAG: DUF1934 domain-containing protein [Acetatifactor sp.]|nr:DUF1934 domain-containing protein [Acetatifactor sp.]
MDSQKVRIIFQTINRPVPGGGEAVSWESSQCHRMELEAEGEYYEKGTTHFCLYTEQPEGWYAPHTVMLKWQDAIL